MKLLWVTLFLLYYSERLKVKADTLVPVPVTTGVINKPVTLTCGLPGEDFSLKEFYWYKQSFGATLNLIVALYNFASLVYGAEFSASRIDVNYKNPYNLTILKTIQEDEGMYHCAVSEIFSKVNRWSGTYLLIKGNTQKTSEISVVQWSTVSGPVHPGDPVTFNCSVFSEKRTCEGDFSVFWFRAGSHQSYPDIIYSDGNRSHECGKRTDIQKSCFHHFSKKVSSSDAGTYYCAVVTCEEILFGNGTKLDVQESIWSQKGNVVLFLQCTVLALMSCRKYLTVKKDKDQLKAHGCILLPSLPR
ncbi:signal-regulatory protein beta-2-like [Pholidichthys leucotaenia]